MTNTAALKQFVSKAVENRFKSPERYKSLCKSVRSGRGLNKWLRALTLSLAILGKDLIQLVSAAPLRPSFIFENKPNQDSDNNIEAVSKEMFVDAVHEMTEMLDDYMEFILKCTSFFNNKYSGVIVETLIQKYFYKYAPSPLVVDEDLIDSLTFPMQGWEYFMTAVRPALIMSQVHEIFEKMIFISPANVKTINEQLQAAFPNIYSTVATAEIGNFVQNCFGLCEHIPTLHSNILEMLINYAVALDINADSCQAKSVTSLSDDDDDDVVSFMESEQEAPESGGETGALVKDEHSDGEESTKSRSVDDPKILILNELLRLLACHLKTATKDNEDLFSSVISNSSILNSLHIKYVPAIIYHSICTNPNYFDWLISFLVLTIFDGQKLNVVRLNCCCVLTILARFKTEQQSTISARKPMDSLADDRDPRMSLLTMTPPPSPKTRDSNTSDEDIFALPESSYRVDSKVDLVSHTLLLLSQYLHCSLDLQTINPTFFHIVNTMLYIFCFRYQELLQLNRIGEMTRTVMENEHMKWWTIRGGFSRILMSKYAVLEVCMPDIVDEFLRICEKYSLFYYSPVVDFKQDHAANDRASDQDTITNSSKNMMELYYFPFDSHILDLDIGQEIEPFYRYQE